MRRIQQGMIQAGSGMIPSGNGMVPAGYGMIPGGNGMIPGGTSGGPVLLISSASIDTTGTVVTLAISGVSGSLSPSSGITGFTVRSGALTSGGTAWYIASSSASGSTVTLTLGTFVPSGTTLLVDLKNSSNLRDISADSATGQTGIAVTNNSTQTATSFASNNANLAFLFVTTNQPNQMGRAWVNTSGGFTTTVVGSSAQALVFNASNVVVSVDGAASTTITSGALNTNSWNWVPVFSGLSDAAHTVRFYCTECDQTTLLKVQGASPSLVSQGTYVPVTLAPFTTESVVDGFYYLPAASISGGSASLGMYGAAVVRFNAAITSLQLYLLPEQSNTPSVAIFQDGVLISNTVFTTNPSGFANLGFDLGPIVSGLDGANHLYEIALPKGGGLLNGILIKGTGITAGSLTAKAYNAFYGDSITALLGITDGLQSASWIVSRNQGLANANIGAGGTAVSTYGRDNTGHVTTLSPAPTTVSIIYGTNDATFLNPIGAVGSPGTFTGDYYTMLVNMRAGLSSTTPIYVYQFYPDVVNAAVRNSYNAAIVTAVSTYITNTGDAHITQAISTDNWINPNSGVDTVDGLHPNGSGYAKIANRMIPIMATTAYTDSGPSSGVHGTPSTNFTVTLATPATFTGDQTITISDGGASGTITPSAGSPGTGSVTVTPVNGATSFTFTYNAASAGSITLTTTNGQTGWINPSSLPFTAS